MQATSALSTVGNPDSGAENFCMRRSRWWILRCSSRNVSSRMSGRAGGMGCTSLSQHFRAGCLSTSLLGLMRPRFQRWFVPPATFAGLCDPPSRTDPGRPARPPSSDSSIPHISRDGSRDLLAASAFFRPTRKPGAAKPHVPTPASKSRTAKRVRKAIRRRKLLGSPAGQPSGCGTWRLR
jgi:hypothetical protein